MKENNSRVFRYVIIAVICAICLGIGGFFGIILSNGGYDYLSYALRRVSLSDNYNIPFHLHGEIYGRDSFKQVVFHVPYESDRHNMMREIMQTDGWTVAPVSAEDYRHFLNAAWYPDSNIVPDDDTVFDAWFYRITTPSAGYEMIMEGAFSSIGRIARGFELAVFDEETGLFIFFDQFG